MTRRWRLALMIAAAMFAIVATALFALGWWAWTTLHQPFQAYEGNQKVVEIERGSTAAAIVHRLETEGIVANAALARLYLIHRLDDPILRAGEYRFEGPMSTPEVLSKLMRGEVVTYPVTIVEGLPLWETADRLAEQGFGDRSRFEAAMRSPVLMLDLDPIAQDLEGYLFPDTYQFARGTTEEEIVATMVTTFRKVWQSDLEPQLADGESLSLRELVTLASIVETEAQLDEERPIIAGVYANRIRRGMRLQADPTVIYALSLAGEYDGNLRRDDLKYESPYNTYVNAGLPPGPIASPGRASLEAAARPAEVPYLYFVSRNDGSHVFARTLREHNRNVNEWQKVYWRKKWAEERRQRAENQSKD